MIVWTHAVLGVLYACVLYFCICTCLAQLSMLQMERCSRNTIIIENYYYWLHPDTDKRYGHTDRQTGKQADMHACMCTHTHTQTHTCSTHCYTHRNTPVYSSDIHKNIHTHTHTDTHSFSLSFFPCAASVKEVNKWVYSIVKRLNVIAADFFFTITDSHNS